MCSWSWLETKPRSQTLEWQNFSAPITLQSHPWPCFSIHVPWVMRWTTSLHQKLGHLLIGNPNHNSASWPWPSYHKGSRPTNSRHRLQELVLETERCKTNIDLADWLHQPPPPHCPQLSELQWGRQAFSSGALSSPGYSKRENDGVAGMQEEKRWHKKRHLALSWKKCEATPCLHNAQRFCYCVW